jgi:hypothetical protein
VCMCVCTDLTLNVRCGTMRGRPLCRDASHGGDYFFSGDGLGHEYYANICASVSTRCLPEQW